MGPVRRAKGVIYENIGQSASFFAKRIVGGLFLMEPDIFEKQHLAFFSVLCFLHGIFSDNIRRQYYFFPSSICSLSATGFMVYLLNPLGLPR